jgi:hypothetical protein
MLVFVFNGTIVVSVLGFVFQELHCYILICYAKIHISWVSNYSRVSINVMPPE